jgi:trk system potassium uptake protein TrkA
MKVVIVGCGRVGSYLAVSLVAGGHQVTVVDNHGIAFERLGDSFQGETVLGTGIDEDVLRRAGIEDANAFVAVTNGDNTNIMASQVVKEIFKVPTVICRIYDPVREEVYRHLGLTTFCPTVVGATAIAKMLEAH